MKRYSTSYVIKEVQIKTMRYHYTLITKAKSQNTDNTKCWRGCRAIGTLIRCWWERKNGMATLEDSLAVPYKTKHVLAIWSSNHTPWIYPRELKTYVHVKNWTQTFIAVLFIIVKTRKQSRCPSVAKWINELWYIQMMDYYPMLKRNHLSTHEKILWKLKCILLSQRSQSENATYYMIPTIWHSGKVRTMVTVKRSVVTSCWGE